MTNKEKDNQAEMKNINNNDKKDNEKTRLEELNKEFDDRNMESISKDDEDLNDEEIDNIDLGG
ncbi:hypothetical protein [Sporohalobacter salinus]|uniref:hypothetical protein n=1 Tax=Sporohalobacter salinus TaxID=1494606 RepID=UPI001961BD73|nr:hypothetical protein [Sporohalobacter salinus]MBM7624447.1 hypothetical protein [Sporohalobacter salinus]